MVLYTCQKENNNTTTSRRTQKLNFCVFFYLRIALTLSLLRRILMNIINWQDTYSFWKMQIYHLAPELSKPVPYEHIQFKYEEVIILFEFEE